MSQTYDQSVGLEPLESSSLQGGRKPTVTDIKRLQPASTVAVRTACNEIGWIPSEKNRLREFLTHGPSLTPDPIRKFKGKGQRVRNHWCASDAIRKTTIVFIYGYALSSPKGSYYDREIRYTVHTQDTRLFVKYLSKIGYENTNICGIPQFLVQYIFT